MYMYYCIVKIAAYLATILSRLFLWYNLLRHLLPTAQSGETETCCEQEQGGRKTVQSDKDGPHI